MSNISYPDKLKDFPEDFYGKLGSKERRQRLQKHSKLQKAYGLTLKAYENMFKAQQGLCAICKSPETGTQNRGSSAVPLSLAVDHDHKTGKVRALLCHKCNKALGLLYDDIGLLQAGIDYLVEHQRQED